MKKYLIILVLTHLVSTVFSAGKTFQVVDKDSGKGLEKVSVILYEDGRKKKLGNTGPQGKFTLDLAHKHNKSKIMLWKKYYKKQYLRVEEIMKNNEPIALKEKKAPAEVTGIRYETKGVSHTLHWDPVPDKDLDYYTVYMRQGLQSYKKWKTKVRETYVEIPELLTEQDYYFQIRAVDKNKNKNKGVEFHYYQGEPVQRLEKKGGIEGSVTGLKGKPGIVTLYPVRLTGHLNVDAAPIVIKCDPQGRFRQDEIPAGLYNIKAWVDLNGNGVWDGNWLGQQAEPRVMVYRLEIVPGRVVERELTLRRGFTTVPRIIYDEHPGYVDLYNAAWEMARAKITPGKTQNGFVNAYMDEGFNNHIYQWDTCFMMFFGIYGGDDFPALNSLDNFYLKQRPNGYICRVQNEDTGGDYDPALSDPSVNPPLYAWIEWTYYRVTGDNSRFLWALTHLDRYYKWLKNNTRREDGHYFTSNLGSGMDNSPREGMAYGWIDMTAQMALFAEYMYKMSGVCNIPESSTFYKQEYDALSSLINRTMWDEDDNIYYDIKKNGKLHRKKTIGSFWPLLSKIVPADRLKGLVAHLEDPQQFKTSHVFPTLSKDEPEYDKKGYYWRGGVWAPTTFMTIKGLEYNGYDVLAYESSLNHIRNMWKVFSAFVPDKERLPYKESNIPFPAHLDGTKQIWELYSPELEEPGTRWDNHFYARPEFVGWSGVGPIVLMIENVLGIHLNAPENIISWTIRSDKRHGVRNLIFNGGSVDLIMEEIKDGKPDIKIESDQVFQLEIQYKGEKYTIRHE